MEHVLRNVLMEPSLLVEVVGLVVTHVLSVKEHLLPALDAHPINSWLRNNASTNVQVC